MHTQASKIYRSTRIPSHTQQCAASMRVLMYLNTRYTRTATERHQQRISKALLHVEKSLH